MDGDAAIGKGVAELGAVDTRVDLDLVHRRYETGARLHLVKMFGEEVGDAECFDEPFFLELRHLLVRLRVEAEHGKRPVDHPDIDIVDAELRQALLERSADVVMVVAAQLCLDVELFARHAAVADALPDGFFVLVA